jgi:hypothetical protein
LFGLGWFFVFGGLVGFMAIGQNKVFALGTYGVTDGAADRTSPDRGK